MTSYTFTEMQLSALRAVVEASRMNDPQVSVPWELLQSLGRLIGCDSMSMEGVDYGRGLTYFAQDTGNGEQHSRSAFDKEEETGFWSLVRQTPRTAPWIPETNESVVVKPTDLMSVRQLRALPLYIDGWGGGPGPTTYLMAMHLEDGSDDSCGCCAGVIRHDVTSTNASGSSCSC